MHSRTTHSKLHYITQAIHNSSLTMPCSRSKIYEQKSNQKPNSASAMLTTNSTGRVYNERARASGFFIDP